MEKWLIHPQKRFIHSIKKVTGLLILMRCINKLYLCVCWWGKGWPVVACPSQTLVVLHRMLTIFACYVLTFMFGTLFLFFNNHLPRMFLSTDFAFRIMDWTCCHGPYLHAIIRIISRGVSSLATDSPCGVWGRGWTTCLLHDSPLFRLTFQNESWYVSLEWYFIYLLFLASVHGFMHETSDFFYSTITFSYTKYFVLCLHLP